VRRFEVPLFDLNFDEAEERAVVETLRSKWIGMGPRTEELERRFAARIGVRNAVAVSSCTAALHLSLAAMGVGPGDEVIVPSLTFVATVNCVRYVGARPVFADVRGPLDLGIDPAEVEALVTSRTRAIVCMHYGGFPCDVDALSRIAARHGIDLVEDAAHAPASSVGGRPLGSMGRAGCFSFYANKNLACGEGGLIATDDDALAEQARRLRSHGMTTVSYDRARGVAMDYDVVALGFNCRFDDVRASIALAQLDKLDADAERRRGVRARYLARLASIDGAWAPYGAPEEPTSEHVFPIVLHEGGAARRDGVRRFMAERGVQTSVHYPAAHRFRPLAEFARPLPRTEFVADHEITLPMHGALTDSAIDRVTDALRDALRERPAAT